jgi:hypothetical protein
MLSVVIHSVVAPITYPQHKVPCLFDNVQNDSAKMYKFTKKFKLAKIEMNGVIVLLFLLSFIFHVLFFFSKLTRHLLSCPYCGPII